MRLIDADELVKLLKANTMSNGTLINTNTMIAVVEKMPTAYDVEKVVAEFEQKIEFYRLKEIETLHKGMAINTRTYTSKRFCFENALEIVKRGGREWKFVVTSVKKQ